MKPSSKNLLALVVSSLLIFGVSGCGKKSGDPAAAPEAPPAAPSESPAAPAPAPAEEAPPAAE